MPIGSKNIYDPAAGGKFAWQFDGRGTHQSVLRQPEQQGVEIERVANPQLAGHGVQLVATWYRLQQALNAGRDDAQADRRRLLCIGG